MALVKKCTRLIVKNNMMQFSHKKYPEKFLHGLNKMISIPTPS